NSYAAIDGGYSDLVFKHVLGTAAGWTWMNAATAAQLAAAVAGAKPTVLGSNKDDAAANVIGDHGYALVGYSAATGKFTLYNPWGSTVDVTWQTLVAD